MQLKSRQSFLVPSSDRWAAAALVGISIVLLGGFRDLAVDDAFVTYRYAENLASGHGFVYNAGELILSTTAPFYGMLLSIFAWPGLPLPLVSNVIGGLAIGVGGAILVLNGSRHGHRVGGWLAGMLYVLSPLLWLTLGMETALYLMLILAAFLADEFDRPGWAGLLLGVAVVTRYDAAVPAAILFLLRSLRLRRPAWRMLLGGVIVALPVLAYLTLIFGSPLPVTLGAKQSQAEVGVTGFFPGTTYLRGLDILVRGWLAQSLLYVFVGIAMVISIARGLERWVLPFFLWALFHVLAYHLLGAAPYYWYYAPLVPAVVLIAALGTEWTTNVLFGRLPRLQKSVLMLIVSTFLLWSSLWSLWGMRQALYGLLPDPSTALSKVLPEAKVDSYQTVGKWLATNTSPVASVGVTEVGVMGYYSRRFMIDFLGLIQPETGQALGKGNLTWTLFNYQPDYLVLTAVNPIYTIDPRQDEWFQVAYRAVKRVDAPRFWGSPVIVYERKSPAVSPPSTEVSEQATLVDAYFGPDIRLLAYEMLDGVLAPGETTSVRLWWQGDAPIAGDYRFSVQFLGKQDLVIAQRDATPGMGLAPTSDWFPGDVIADLALVGIPRTACAPDEVRLNLVLYDASTGIRLPVTSASGELLGDSLRLDSLMLLPASSIDAIGVFAGGISLDSYELSSRAVAPGQSVGIELEWDSRQAWNGWSVFVHLISEETGQRIAGSDGPLMFGASDQRTLVLPEDAAAGVYLPIIGIYRPDSGDRLPLVDAVGHSFADSLQLCPIRIQ